MKKKIYLIIVLLLCLVITGCSSNRYNQEEIDRIANIVNGTGE